MQNLLREAHHHPSQHMNQPPPKIQVYTLLRDQPVQCADGDANQKCESKVITSVYEDYCLLGCDSV